MGIETQLRELVRGAVHDELESALSELRTLMQTLVPARQPAVEVFTVAEVATAMKVSEPTVLEWIKRGHLKAAKLPDGREWRIHRGELEKLTMASATSPETATVRQAAKREAARIMSLHRGRVGGSGG